MNATLLEPEDLLTLPDGDSHELIDGVPVEKAMGAKADKLALDIAAVLRAFVRAHKLGYVFGSATGYACFPHNPRTFRKPDASFVRLDKLPHGVPDGLLTVAPDLVVESVSSTDSAQDLENTIALYREAGVALIWVLYPQTRTALVRRHDGTAQEVGPAGNLDGESVLPGFTCRIADLFD